MRVIEQIEHPFFARARSRAADRAFGGPLLLCAGFFLLSFALQSFRLTSTPDLFADEGLYYVVGRNIAAGRGLTELSGKLFVWHPPFYMFLESAYLRFFGLVQADPVSAILQLRMINVVAAALTASFLFLIGRQVRGSLTGACIALVYCLDPYVQRINRRSMLETVATLFVVIGMFFFISLPYKEGKRRRILAGLPIGIYFGLALLTKEVMVFALGVPVLFAIFFRKDSFLRAVSIVSTALTVYSLYPLLLFATGHGDAYLDMKQRQVMRLFGRFLRPDQLVATTPRVSAGKVSVVQTIEAYLPQYVVSYILIACAVTIAILLFYRRRSHGEAILVAWIISAYGFVGIGILFGQISDQFFYFIIVPAIVLLGVFIGRSIEEVGRIIQRPVESPGASIQSRGFAVVAFTRHVAPLVVVGLCLIWNAGVYARVYASGQDNSYAELIAHIKRTIPPGTTIVFGSDIANYVLPDYRVRFLRNAESVRAEEARYIVLSTKESWGGYAAVTPDFYDWVAANGTVRFEQYGNTFWDLRLFEVRPPELDR